MSQLRRSLTEYLAVRRALGYKLDKQETLLGQFLDYLEARGQEHITTAQALAWAALPAGGECWHSYRLQAVRGFARYLHAIDPEVQVPAVGLLPDRPHRAMPFLYTDEQIAALILAAEKLGSSHRVATHQTLIGLLSVTGMRIGEAAALDRSDFDSREGVLLVRGAKFGKSRELPLHRSTVLALRRYLRRRDRPPSPPGVAALFVSTTGTRLRVGDVDVAFRGLVRRAGIEPRWAMSPPRLRHLRHTFAVRTLLEAYRSGQDIPARLALLSTYMGHVDPSSTYWYLQAAPELMALAGERLERHLQGGQR
jgi:integrase/recombinase XerD